MNNKLGRNEWRLLLNKIDNEEVVLILGEELSSVFHKGQRKLLKDYVLESLAKAIKVDYDETLDFSQLSYEYKKGEWQKNHSDPYTETRNTIEDIDDPDIESVSYDTTHLRKLLSIDKFKTVLTTCYDNAAFSVLNDLYKGDVERLTYNRGSNGQDINPKEGKRILYHLFGKASAMQHGFVLTEDDLLEYIHLWMDPNYRPEKLSNLLREKYILAIGCNYPNWLFRFFFHSLKYKTTMTGYSKKSGLLADNHLDPELISFLQRMETSVHEDAIKFIDELCEQWERYKHKASDSHEILPQSADSEECEAFLSYASEDYETASKIADTFRKFGLKIWFDKKNLEGGDEYERLIKYRIEHSKVFIPILSSNTEVTGGRFFRKEWKWATDALVSHFGLNDNYIQPIIIDNYKITDKHVFNQFHCIDLSDHDEWDVSIKRMVRRIHI